MHASHYGRGKMEGKAEGLAEGKAEVARNLIALGLPIAKIIAATGFSEKEILAFKE